MPIKQQDQQQVQELNQPQQKAPDQLQALTLSQQQINLQIQLLIHPQIQPQNQQQSQEQNLP